MIDPKPAPHFAVCIKTDDSDLITPRMIYEILPDESAAQSNYIRVIDNEGEDYLYPADYFVVMDFPQVIHPLLHVSRPPSERAPIRRKQRASSGRPRKAKEKAA